MSYKISSNSADLDQIASAKQMMLKR